MSLKELLIAWLLFVPILLGSHLLVYGSSHLFDGYTLLLCLIYTTLLSYAIFRHSGAIMLQLSALAIFSSLMIFPRLIEYLIAPQFVIFPYHFVFDAYAVNFALVELIIGSVLIYFGFVVGDRLLRKVGDKGGALITLDATQVRRADALIIFFVITCVVVYINVYLGSSAICNYNFGVKVPLVGIISHLIHLPTAFMLTLSIVAFGLDVNRRSAYLSLIIVLYLLVTVATGSRAAPLTIVTFSAFMILFSIPSLKVPVRKWVVGGVAAAVAAAVIFNVGTYIRVHSMVACKDETYKSAAAEDDDFEGQLPTNVIEKKRDVRTIVKGVSGWQAILNRIGVIDNVVIFSNIEGERKLLDKYASPSYLIKSYINIVIPGVVFDDATINSAFMPPFIYGGLDTKLLERKGYYETKYWTAWGVLDAMFGSVYKWIAFFFVGVVMIAGHLILMRVFGESGKYVGPLYLMAVSFQFYGNMGLDDYFVNITWVIVAVVVYASLMYALVFFKKRCRILLSCYTD